MSVATMHKERNKSSIPDTFTERLSPATENYLLCLYKMREDFEFPTITQLTEYLRQLPATESLGTSALRGGDAMKIVVDGAYPMGRFHRLFYSNNPV